MTATDWLVSLVLEFSFLIIIPAANVAFKKAVASSPIIDGYRANSLVDADTQSCIYLDMQVLDRYVQIDLGTNQLIAGLVIHIPEGNHRNQYALQINVMNTNSN